MQLFSSPRFFKVTIASALILLLETVLFHVVAYIHDFFGATSVVAYAVLGLGLGAFVANHIRLKENVVFFLACLGTTLSIYLVSFILVRYPVLWAVAAGCALCILFPTIYITTLFRNHPGGRVYLYDMGGAFLGVAATVLLYFLTSSEAIILLVASLLPAVALVDALREKTFRLKKIAIFTAGPLVILGTVLLVLQLAQDRFDIFYLYNRNGPLKSYKVFAYNAPDRLAKSYDSLVGRIDIVKFADDTGYLTCYDGHPNDHFKPIKELEYDHFKKNNVRFPSEDLRVLNGVVQEPRIFIIGSAARGITNLVKKITPADRIFPVEIQPAIIQIMTKDFYTQSGMAYRGLRPIVGNAISLLKSNDTPYDLITLINTHSGPNIGVHSGPDYLHTEEQYNLYFDNLSDNGYLQFEERPGNRGGALGLFRMINTLWHTLKARGSSDPSRHFFIWEWQGAGGYPNIQDGYDQYGNRYAGPAWYVGMAVFKNPLNDERRDLVADWYRIGGGVGRVGYLKGYMETGEFSDIMSMVEIGDFSPLKKEGFDTSLVTNDRPFPSFSTDNAEEIEAILKYMGIVCLFLCVVFVVGVYWKSPALRASYLISYNVLIGFGYFLIEIMLMQSYQNLFISPSWSTLLVLGLLLLSSGIGGMFSGKIPIAAATALLIPLAFAATYVPSLVTLTDIPTVLCKGLGVALIFVSGFLMGLFFPGGLVLAERWGMQLKIPYLFALNSIAGSYAVILALYSGVTLGYQTTILAAVFLYAAAALLLSRNQFAGADAA